MNKGLWLLWFFRTRGFFRRFFTWRGAILLLLAGGAILFFMVFGGLMAEEMSPHALFPVLALLLIVAFSPAMFWGREPSVWFCWPAEVDQLFSAPVSRREILIVRHLNDLLILLLASLCGAIWFFEAIRSYWEAFATLFVLGLILSGGMQLLAQLFLLVGEWKPAAGRVLAWSGTGFVIFGVWEIVDAFRRSDALSGLCATDLGMHAALLRETVFATIALLPLAPVELMTGAADRSTFFSGLAGGCGIYLTFFGTALWLNRDFRMPAYKIAEQWKAARKSVRLGEAGTAGATKRSSSNRSLCPHWGGFGPIAWCELIRERAIFRRGLIIALFVFFGFLWMHHLAAGRLDDILLLYLILFSILFGSQTLPSTSIDSYRALPIAPATLASGLVFPAAVRDFLTAAPGAIVLGFLTDRVLLVSLLTSFLLPTYILLRAVGKNCDFFFQSSLAADPVRTTLNIILIMILDGFVLFSMAALSLSAFLAVKLITNTPWLLWLSAWTAALMLALGFVAILVWSIRSNRAR